MKCYRDLVTDETVRESFEAKSAESSMAGKVVPYLRVETLEELELVEIHQLCRRQRRLLGHCRLPSFCEHSDVSILKI